MNTDRLKCRVMPGNRSRYILRGQVPEEIGPGYPQGLLDGKSQKGEMMADFEDETPNTKKTSGVDSKNGSRQEGLYQEYASLKEMSQALVEISSNYYLEEKKINGEKKKRIKCDQKRRIEKRCRLKSKNGSRQEGWVQEDASLKETSQILEEESSNYYLAEKGKMGYYRKKKLDKKGRLDGLVANRLKKIQH